MHALMQSNLKPSAAPHVAANVQRLCTYAGRTQQGLEEQLTKMRTQHAGSVEAHALLQETAAMPASSHPYRGYTILNKEPPVQEVQVGRGRDACVLMSLRFHRSIACKNQSCLGH